MVNIAYKREDYHMSSWKHHTMRVKANSLSFHVTVDGNGPAVLLLHGFPDSSQVWKLQIPVLVSAGYKVIAPDLRGCGQSDRPQGKEAYAMYLLVADVIGILDGLGLNKVAVVGHDWGAALAWQVAMRHPQRVERLCCASTGHPGSFFAAGGAQQRAASWYMLLFQFEGAERALQADGFRTLRELMEPIGDEDFRQYVANFETPGALTAGLNWYRANFRLEHYLAVELGQFPLLEMPVLALRGTEDRMLLRTQMEASRRYVSGPWQYVEPEGAGHWLQREAPERFNALLLNFLGPLAKL